MTDMAADLQRLSEAASFTIQDMAAWCGLHKAAMREWMSGRHEPHPINRKYLEASLRRLEWALQHSKLLPVPKEIKMYERADYVKRVRDHALKEIPKSGASN